MARLSVEELAVFRQFATVLDQDLFDTIDALQSELAESEEERDMNRRGIEEGIRREDHLRKQLAPGPCGKHRMCDWAYGSPLPDQTWNLEHPTASTTTGYCLACERGAAERKAAVQAALEKAIAAALTERDIQPYEGGTFTRWDACDNVVIRLRALAAEGGGK